MVVPAVAFVNLPDRFVWCINLHICALTWPYLTWCGPSLPVWVSVCLFSVVGLVWLDSPSHSSSLWSRRGDPPPPGSGGSVGCQGWGKRIRSDRQPCTYYHTVCVQRRVYVCTVCMYRGCFHFVNYVLSWPSPLKMIVCIHASVATQCTLYTLWNA